MNVAKFARVLPFAARSSLLLQARALSATVSPAAIKMVDWQRKIPVPPELLTPLSVPAKVLFGPGPSNPSMRIYNASAMSLLGHMQADFYKVMDEVKAGLQYLFQTNNRYTLAITGAGHAAMEASIMNLVERGERILVCENGMWGKRAREIAERQGIVNRVLKVAKKLVLLRVKIGTPWLQYLAFSRPLHPANFLLIICSAFHSLLALLFNHISAEFFSIFWQLTSIFVS